MAGDCLVNLVAALRAGVVFTALDAKRLTDDELLQFARRLLDQGCVYACLWGPEALRVAQLQAMASRIEALVERCQRLAEENRSLRNQHEQISGERSQLLAKNEQARTRVEAMIARLKSLEQHT